MSVYKLSEDLKIILSPIKLRIAITVWQEAKLRIAITVWQEAMSFKQLHKQLF